MGVAGSLPFCILGFWGWNPQELGSLCVTPSNSGGLGFALLALEEKGTEIPSMSQALKCQVSGFRK